MFPIIAVGLLGLATAWQVSPDPPSNAATITSPFVSYASEFNFFNEYSGDDVSGANDFSYNLLKNIGDVLGTMPYWRVGGNAQQVLLSRAIQALTIADHTAIETHAFITHHSQNPS